MANGLTQLQVYNRALSEIGARAQMTATTDPTVEGGVLDNHFQPAFNFLLQMHDWSFGRSRVALVANTTQFLAGWAGVFNAPTGCLNFLGIFNGIGWGTLPIIPFEAVTQSGEPPVIGTNFPSPIGVFTAALTDPSVTSPLFCEALVFTLASYAAFDITESAQLGPALMQAAVNHAANAWERDQQQRYTQVGTRYPAGWLRDRL